MSKVAWAAGVIESDGTIHFKRNPAARRGQYPRLRVTITDEDIVRDLQATLGGLVRGPRIHSRNKTNFAKPPAFVQPLWTWEVNKRDDVKKILALLRPWFHSRRGEKADEVLSFIEEV